METKHTIVIPQAEPEQVAEILQYEIKQFSIQIQSFPRAEHFYQQAFGFKTWAADYPLPSNPEILFFKDGKRALSTPGYFIKLSNDGWASLVYLGIDHEGYSGVIDVVNVEHTLSEITNAGGEVYSSRASHADTSKGERPISIEPFSQCALFSDTEGNMFELRSRGHI